MLPTEANRSIIQAFVAAINRQDGDRLDELVVPDFVRNSYAAGQPGVNSRETLKAFLQQEFTTFPDAHEEIVDLLAEGDKVAARHHSW